jgi:hypothetical protein
MLFPFHIFAIQCVQLAYDMMMLRIVTGLEALLGQQQIHFVGANLPIFLEHVSVCISHGTTEALKRL